MLDSLSSVINGILAVGKLFGLSPISLDSKGQARTRHVIMAYAVQLALLFIVLIAVDEYHQAHDQTLVVELVNSLGLVAFTLQFLVNLIFGWVHAADLRHLVAAIVRLEKYVEGATRLKLNLARLKRIAGSVLASIALFVAFALGYECYDLAHVEIASKLRFVLLYISLANTGVVVFQVAALAFVILELYENLSRYLDKICRDEVDLKRNADGLYLEDFRAMVVSTNSLAETLNRCFSNQMLIVFLNGFINITVHSYHALKDTRTYYQYYIATAGKIGVFIYHMVLLALVSQRIANKVTSIGLKLFKFPKHTLAFLRSEAVQISLHLRNYPVVFTAKHFFRIDASTMLSIAATVCSYLIILMQSNAAPSIQYQRNRNVVAYSDGFVHPGEIDANLAK